MHLSMMNLWGSQSSIEWQRQKCVHLVSMIFDLFWLSYSVRQITFQVQQVTDICINVSLLLS
jgi:hypothetical protein